MSTTTSGNSSVIRSEKIEAAMSRQLNLTPLLAVRMADAGGVEPGVGNTVQIPYPDDVTVPAGTKAENAEFPIIDASTSNFTVSDGEIGFTFRISKRLQMSGVIDYAASCAMRGVRKIADRLDSDGFSVITGAANTVDDGSNELTEDIFLRQKFLFEAQYPDIGPAGIAYVASYNAIGAWIRNLADPSASTGASVHFHGSEAEAASLRQMFGVNRGIQGIRHGVVIGKSGNLPVNGTEVSTAFMTLGETSPLVYRAWEPIDYEMRWVQERKAWHLTVSCRVGWSKGRDAELRELIVADTNAA